MNGSSRWFAVLAVMAGIVYLPNTASAQVFVQGPVVTQWSPAPVQVVQPTFVAPAPVTSVTKRYGLFGRRRSTVVTQRPTVITPAPVFVPTPVVTTTSWSQPVFIR